MKDLYKLIGDYERFTKGVYQRLDSIDKRLDTGDKRMGSIENKISSPQCPFHADVIAKIQKEEQKNDDQGKDIEELKTTTAVQEVKLSEKQEKQLNYTTGGLSLLAIYQAAKFILALVGIHLPG